LHGTIEYSHHHLDSLVNSGAANEDNISPLLQQLTGAFDTSAVSFQALQGNVDPSTGGSEQQVANEVATVYTVSLYFTYS